MASSTAEVSAFFAGRPIWTNPDSIPKFKTSGFLEDITVMKAQRPDHRATRRRLT